MIAKLPNECLLLQSFYRLMMKSLCHSCSSRSSSLFYIAALAAVLGQQTHGGAAVAFTTTTSSKWSRPLLERNFNTAKLRNYDVPRTNLIQRIFSNSQMADEEQDLNDDDYESARNQLPKQNRAGIYQILDQDQHA